MHTIRKRIGILLVCCSFAAIFLTMMFVNFTINDIFEDYMDNVQNKRYERIVTYLEGIYIHEGYWSETSGAELLHEAYMSNYNLTLYDEQHKPIWGMNPMDIRNKIHLENMIVQDQGVYNTKKFELKNNGETIGYVEVGQYAPLLMTEEDIKFKSSVNYSIALSGVISIIIITVISLYFSKQFSTPIKEVANMSVRLSKGEFKEKSNTKTNIAEIIDLRNSINILAENLNSQDLLRRRLIADISHEIRTPLNVLQNNLEAMIDGVFPVTDERLARLNDEVIRFGNLLNNLDKLKEFEDESMKLNFQSLNLTNIIDNLYKDFLLEAKNKNITLKFLKDENKDYFILGDEDKLKQVFINIINNSLKFTNENGEVLIELYEEKDNLCVSIKDNGIGIKKEDLPFIFERMYRGDKSRHETEGSGIGLTIVKNILDMHSADINVESNEGNGSVFTVCFVDKCTSWLP